MNLHTLHQVWLGGDELPEVMRLYQRILLMRHSAWRHYVWTEDNVSELGLEPWQYEHATKAGSSNIIRLHALKQYGGVYVDFDVEILYPLDELLKHSAFVARQSDGVLCNAIFGAEPNHPWINQMIADYGDQRVKDAAWGCHVMDKASEFGVTILPTETFFPWSFDECPDRSRITPDTLAVHLWNGSWHE